MSNKEQNTMAATFNATRNPLKQKVCSE